MENPDQDLLLLESVRQTQSTDSDTAVSSEPEQEQTDETELNTQHESNQETSEPRHRPPPLALIEFRIQQLYNRRFLLLKMQSLMKKAEDKSGRTTEEMTCEDRDELCELDAIQKELEELMVKKETLEKQGKSTSLQGNEDQQDSPTFYKTETPHGGIYMLPPPQLAQEEVTLEWGVKPSEAEEKPTGPITAVDNLGQMPAVTKCPSCDEVIYTETHSTVGETMWMLCCLCSIMGCVAGCCLIPFFIDRLKSVQHHCPQCQAHIHTYRPF